MHRFFHSLHFISVQSSVEFAHKINGLIGSFGFTANCSSCKFHFPTFYIHSFKKKNLVIVKLSLNQHDESHILFGFFLIYLFQFGMNQNCERKFQFVVVVFFFEIKVNFSKKKKIDGDFSLLTLLQFVQREW